MQDPDLKIHGGGNNQSPQVQRTILTHGPAPRWGVPQRSTPLFEPKKKKRDHLQTASPTEYPGCNQVAHQNRHEQSRPGIIRNRITCAQQLMKRQPWHMGWTGVPPDRSFDDQRIIRHLARSRRGASGANQAMSALRKDQPSSGRPHLLRLHVVQPGTWTKIPRTALGPSRALPDSSDVHVWFWSSLHRLAAALSMASFLAYNARSRSRPVFSWSQVPLVGWGPLPVQPWALATVPEAIGATWAGFIRNLMSADQPVKCFPGICLKLESWSDKATVADPWISPP